VRAGALLAVVTVCAAAALPASAANPVRVTMLADSVGSALLWDPGPFADFSAGLDVRGDAYGCRKLVVPGCPWEAGGTPPSALDTINSLGVDLGPVVVMDVGYNDSPATFSDSLDTVMTALLAHGVQRVVWVTLNETEGVWKQSNEIIRAASGRWPQLAVADWGAVKLDPSWFQEDAVHFDHDGAVAFGSFLRPIVLAQVQLVVDTLPPVMHLPAVIHARAASANGRVIRIEPVAVDATDGVVPVTCTPASPHRFRVGRTHVTCRATDKAGNTASGKFDVYVTRARKSAAAH
jgi:hypothetical protein